MNEIFLTSERIERFALEDLHAAATPEIREVLGLRFEKVGDFFVSIATQEPSILLNRTIGLGVDKSVTKQNISQVITLYADAGIGHYFIHVHPAAKPLSIRGWLLNNGLSKHRGWTQFRREPVPPLNVKSELDIRLIDAEHAAAFGRIVAPCFGLSDATGPLLASLVGRSGWYIYMAFDGEDAVGAGAMFVKDGVAWFDWAGTHRAYRGRGGQTGVLCERIRRANELGCHLLVTAMREAVSERPQNSYRNIVRAGFEPMYIRENYEPSLRG